MSSHSLAALLARALAVVLAAGGGPGGASAPASLPMLRIEAGVHTAPIRKIIADPNGLFIATASTDKTVRLWDAATRERLRTLRPPMAPGNEGQLEALAIALDGSQLATGGQTGEKGPYCVYLFEPGTGKLTRRLTGLPGKILSLAFTPDGHALAVGMIEGGMRVVATSSGRTLFADSDYEDAVYGLDMARDGRIAAAAFDGALRIYGPRPGGSYALTRKVATLSAHRPKAIRFSPDGFQVAVGYYDRPLVEIRNALNPSLVTALPPLDGFRGAEVNHLTWEADGTGLYAGSGSQIRKWRVPSYASHEDLPIRLSLDSTPLPGGGMAYATSEPRWGILGAEDTPPVQWDFSNTVLTTADGGAEVGFTLGNGATEHFQFQVRGGRLAQGAPAGGRPPRTQSDTIEILDWKNTIAPKAQGLTLHLLKNERARCLAIAWDDSTFTLGCDWTLRHYDRRGQQLWQQEAPGPVWAVAYTDDQRLVVAAFGDGTLRWFQAADGTELLALFPHQDRRQWILWSPSGRYECPPAAEDLIGWHVNRGPNDAADFFRASRFRDRFFQPGFAIRSLGALVEVPALPGTPGLPSAPARILDILPPVVSILAPPWGTTFSTPEVAVTVEARSPSGAAVTSFTVLADGVPVHFEDLPGPGPAQRTLKLRLPRPEACMVAIIAGTQGRMGEPERVLLQWNRPGLTGSSLSTPEPGSGPPRVSFAGLPGELPCFQRDMVVPLELENLGHGPFRILCALDGEAWGGRALRPQLDRSGGHVRVDLPLTVPERDCTLQVKVVSDGLESKPVALTLRWIGKGPGPGLPVYDTLHLVCVGVSRYGDPAFNLELPHKDALDFAAFFREQEGLLYRKVAVTMLLNEQATKGGLQASFRELGPRVGPNDVVMLFLAGHGLEVEARFWFVPYDCLDLMDRETLVADRELFALFQDLACKGRMLFVDACHAGALNLGRFVMEGGEAQSGLALFASSSRTEESQESARRWGNGAFTHALLAGLRGEANGGRHTGVTVKELGAFVETEVPRLTQDAQNPRCKESELLPSRFLLALRRPPAGAVGRRLRSPGFLLPKQPQGEEQIGFQGICQKVVPGFPGLPPFQPLSKLLP